jgi:hypothetical protein
VLTSSRPYDGGRTSSTLESAIRYGGREEVSSLASRPVSPEAAGSLVAFLETGALRSRRLTVISRLRVLRDSEEFASLPDDLRDKIRELLEAERR